MTLGEIRTEIDEQISVFEQFHDFEIKEKDHLVDTLGLLFCNLLEREVAEAIDDFSHNIGL